MSLFPKWRGTASLPALPSRKGKIGANWVYQDVFRGAVRKADLLDSQYKGHDEIVLRDISAPFDRFLVRRKGARKLDTPQPVVTIRGPSDGDHLELAWDSYGHLETYADTEAQWDRVVVF